MVDTSTGISIQVEVEPREDPRGWNYFKYMETPQARHPPRKAGNLPRNRWFQRAGTLRWVVKHNEPSINH